MDAIKESDYVLRATTLVFLVQPSFEGVYISRETINCVITIITVCWVFTQLINGEHVNHYV